jgi:hypothetical protein
VIPSIMIELGTCRYARWLTAPLINTAVGEPGTGAACQGPNLNTQSYRSPFHEHYDVHCSGFVLSEAKSGQSGLPLLNEGQVSGCEPEVN